MSLKKKFIYELALQHIPAYSIHMKFNPNNIMGKKITKISFDIKCGKNVYDELINKNDFK